MSCKNFIVTENVRACMARGTAYCDAYSMAGIMETIKECDCKDYKEKENE